MGLLHAAWLRELIGQPHGASSTPPDGQALTGPLLIAYASQTGVTEDLAYATHEQLRARGVATRVLEFEALDAATLAVTTQALFLTSTTCDGDPPDMAETFRDTCMSQPASLTHLHYGLLALGDRAYGDFCGFGRALDGWLTASGAQPWFARIEVDDEDAAALERWHAQVATLASRAVHA